MQVSVKIGPEFFAKAALDYGDKWFAFAREILQNSIDAAGCTRISVTIATEHGHTVAVIENNGIPMTREVLLEKLLVLGASGKNFTGTNVGGFGKAKELLYYMHEQYEIRTGTFLVQGRGGECEIQQELDNLHGTKSTVHWGESCTERLIEAFREFAQYAQWSGTLTLITDSGAEVLATNLRKGSPRREFDWCKIYTNRTYYNILIVRAGGIPMFTKPTGFAGTVIVELTGDPTDACPTAPSKLLTANRDGLKYKHRCELDEFVTSLSVDKRSALREQKATYKLYEGERLKRPWAAKTQDLDVQQLISSPAPTTNSNGATRMGGIRVSATYQVKSTVSIGPRLILKNTTGLDTPDYYKPGEYFSNYTRDLMKSWAKVLITLYELLELDGEFSIGLLLDEENTAEHEQSSAYGRVYYLNPAEVVQQKNENGVYTTVPRSFRKRFTGAWSDRYEIISLAAHEVVHGMGHSTHDEDYAQVFTTVNAKIYANMVRLSKCFRD